MKLAKFLERVEFGKRLTRRNLTIIPLHGNGHKRLDYMLGSDAICAGLLEVGEVDEGGVVPEVVVTSKAEKSVLLLEGEQLVGAKQNRILNISILLRPRSKTHIPVSCVEAGRWRDVSRYFAPGPLSHPKLRAKTSHSVTHFLREMRCPRSDQGMVWEEVDEAFEKVGASSPTAALSDAIEHRKTSLDDYVAKVAYPAGACGLLAAIDGQFVALDLFDKPETCERVWERLVRSYAFDALPTAGRRRKSFRTATADKIVGEIADAPLWKAPSVGEGQHWRLETERLVGSALIARQTCVHLAAFPRPAGHTRRGDEISPPSVRRRARPDGGIVY